ncbi:hypothetical protein [Streptomyces sp. NPDC016845]
MSMFVGGSTTGGGPMTDVRPPFRPDRGSGSRSGSDLWAGP